MFTTCSHKILHRARSLRKLRPEDHPSHRRQISTASDVSRASSSGSDTAGRDHSVEWDSLRLHPSLEVDRSPHIIRHDEEKSPSHSYFETHSNEVEQQQPLLRPRHMRQQFSLEIHEGFDFGFEKPQTSRSNGGPGLRAPKSEADLRGSRRDVGGIDTSAPSPTKRPHLAGFDEADFFIKRGGWKRRGIVFSAPQVTPESEDDTFEIP